MSSEPSKGLLYGFFGAMGVGTAIVVFFICFTLVCIFACGGCMWFGASTVSTAVDDAQKKNGDFQQRVAIEKAKMEEKAKREAERQLEEIPTVRPEDAKRQDDAQVRELPPIKKGPSPEEIKAKAEQDAADKKETDLQAAIEANEKAANAKLRAAEPLREAGKKIPYALALEDIIKKYPGTEAAKKAREILDK